MFVFLMMRFSRITLYVYVHVHVHEYFSNALIIHDVKTKKIRGMKKVWIPGLN